MDSKRQIFGRKEREEDKKEGKIFKKLNDFLRKIKIPLDIFLVIYYNKTIPSGELWGKKG